jgi:hypothetical protein
MSNNTYRSAIALTLMSGPAAPLPLVADLRYDASDPFAVRVLFDVGAPEPVSWVFSRDLLDIGLVEPVGEGDVRVEPVVDVHGQQSVRLSLIVPESQAQLDIATDDVLEFLASSYEIVPPGEESSRLDLDGTVSALLSL